ncbi:hypothetical protein [Streptomyces sp. CC224B]|uniref:hypothetical protein n=1 Tax=Streptomyces sp. CC224B TaxID=3044571 RepID=UPI0024A854E8|nr:hypothetical protein [Streptomyces sp. CC224B]
MSEAIIGGLVGGPLGAVIALVGNYFVVRDSRWGREAAAEQQAAAKLRAILRSVHLGDRSVRGYNHQLRFTEDCYVEIFSFRHRQVRERLSTSIVMYMNATVSPRVAGPEAALYAQHIALLDVHEVLEARLDRKRLPRPHPEWVAATKDLPEAMEELQARMVDERREFERQQEAVE